MPVKSNVRGYSDKELLDRVRAIGGKVSSLKNLLIFVRSKENDENKFDDKVYHFHKGKFVRVTSCTTEPGRTALYFFKDYNLPGAAVLVADRFYTNGLVRGMHRGKMRALRQNVPFDFTRDHDKNRKAENYGEIFSKIIYTNFHGVDYDPNSVITREEIGPWSFGCLVANVMEKYRAIIKDCWKQKFTDVAILNEF